ncbi:MAG TPA: hypothetical protein VEW68_01570 [Patescibacteria group bacterium]|nr:hypothetical protein [Patescibacteria group bacterium]
MLMVTAVWGWTFVLVKDAVTQYPTLPFLQLRFVLAFLVIASSSTAEIIPPCTISLYP